MASLDLFIVNVAFDSIGRSFSGSTMSDLSWILNGYAIIYAALLVPAGRLADRVSRKRGFLFGLILFTVASGACAISTNLIELVIFRLLQAAGAAALTPTSLGLLLPVFSDERRAAAVRVWAATGALAAAFGPVVGGFLVEASWRWVFLVNLPIGIVAVIATIRYVPDSRDDEAGAVPDLLGAALAAISVGAVSLALVKGPDWGWGDVRTLLSFAAAVVTAALFWVRSQRHPVPVVEPALLRVRAFAWSNLTAVLFTVGFAANLLVNILWMQQSWGYGPIRTGLAVAPGPLMVPLFAILAGALAARGLSVGKITATGCIMFGAACVLTMFRVDLHPAYASELLPSQILGGAGVGLALPTIISAATSGLPANRSSTGSAVNTMARQLGSVLGVSALIALIGTPKSPFEARDVFHHVWLMCGVASLLAAVTAAIGMTPRERKTELDDEVGSGAAPQAHSGRHLAA